MRLGDGIGNFSGSNNMSIGSVPTSVAVGDYDADGKQDLAIAN
ncbi:MAG: VCBS repeat-containing protein [Bacteroidetes bacterium]|nr:VCBS repeat-containing protein [Bacteroidota bacterium]